MSGFRRVEHDHGYGYIYDKNHKTPEQEMDELWDENIDYILALRRVVASLKYDENESSDDAYFVALRVLNKHNKLEENHEKNTTDSSTDVGPDGL